ncbi:distal membrane-arm assembly complex protein 2 [Odontomachus brunneus]|uniref:distal membrane-arm assembly complex protein 2 n=1 Tax=Odontomachus brunneus TaxID=486640 RepID=UPI0013F27F17|nr:distal membrane-arm assembly complex protein 2 [Odontomachus brunneus]
MLTRRIPSVLTQKISELVCFRDKSLLFVQTRTYGMDHEIKQYERRNKEEDLEKSLPDDDPEKPKTFLWFPTAAPTGHEFKIGNLKHWYNYHKTLTKKKNQEFIPERHETLGSNLATAHFIVYRGGKVKFKNSDFWVELNKDGTSNLPNKFDPYYILEMVDVNGFDLYYEGLSNLCGLTKLKWLSIKNCKNIDDWGLDKISAEFPELVHLDISGCEKITERGLESLYRMLNLKTLIVTNHKKSAAFELTCMMLEDCIPGLSCEIHEPLKIVEE